MHKPAFSIGSGAWGTGRQLRPMVIKGVTLWSLFFFSGGGEVELELHTPHSYKVEF